MNTKSEKTDNDCPTDTIKPINTFEELVKSNLCMMYFARGCMNKRYARGLCDKHYHMVRRCVKSGSLKWERVEAQLKALPAYQGKERLIDILKELCE